MGTYCPGITDASSGFWISRQNHALQQSVSARLSRASSVKVARMLSWAND